MRRVLMCLALFVLAGCQKTESTQRPVKVTVSYSGFLPECVRVIARDVGGEGELSAEPPGKGSREAGGQLVIAVMTPEGWGDSVEIEVQAFEKVCTGKMVASDKTTVTLKRGTPVDAPLTMAAVDRDQDGYVSRASNGTDCNDDQGAISPEAQERCNDIDDDCDEVRDEGFELGQACSEGPGCEGTWQCGVSGTRVCGNIPNATMAYPDSDRDGHGDSSAPARPFCGAVPADYTTGPRDDCNDTLASVHGGAAERCDALDNDCDNQTDEEYSGLGTTCLDPATQCNGERRCNGDGSGVTCVRTQQAATWYPDEDGDGFGDPDRSSTSCVQPPGFIDRAGDCDDGNRFTHEDAAEICDGLDNDCDDAPEAAIVCPNGANWAVQVVPDANQLWHSVSTWAEGSVWVVGNNNRRAVLTPSSSTGFQVSDSTANGCGSPTTAWYTVWAEPLSNGRAYFGSAGGRLAYQDPGAADCFSPANTPSVAVRSLVGLRNNGALELYGTSDNAAANEGKAFYWNGASTLTLNPASNVIAPVLDVHGLSRNTLFAVGGLNAEPNIYSFNFTNIQLEPATMETHSSLRQLKGVWVVSAKVAFAVGNSGTAMRWNGTAWSRLAFPNNDDLTSVVAFGASSAYAVSSNGRVYRYDGSAWTQIHAVTGAQFLDIAGTSPADLWVVGNGGRILHWPQ